MKLTKNNILNEYKSNKYSDYLCNFTKNIDADLGERFQQYLEQENILRRRNSSINTLNSFIEFYKHSQMEPMYTFRYMILEDFLTKQGIE